MLIPNTKLNQTSNFRAKTKECTKAYMTEPATREITKDHLRMGNGITYGFIDKSNSSFRHVYLSGRKYKESEKILIATEEIASDSRETICAHLSFQPNSLKILNQTHSKKCVEVNKNTNTSILEADAMLCLEPGVLLGIQTADCLPILIHSKSCGAIAAIHSGWRGTVSGVIENTIDMMDKNSINIVNLDVYIMPSIQQQSYEVSEDLYKEFIKRDKEFDQFFTVINNKTGHFLFDLPASAVYILKKLGIKNILHDNRDTYTNNMMFSYRRSTHLKEIYYGSNLSFIGIRDV